MKISKLNFRNVRLVVSGIFMVASAWLIWRQHYRITKEVANFHLVADALVTPLAIAVSGLLVLAGGLLLAGFFVPFILRAAVGGVFVVAGAMKMWDPGSFAKDIANYRLLPDTLVNLAAITLPWIEVLAGGMLIVGIWKKPNALLITLLLAVFLVCIGQAVYRHLDIRCGCFSTLEARKVGWTALIEDGVLFLVAAWVAWWYDDIYV